jgi:hypothetical protein
MKLTTLLLAFAAAFIVSNSVHGQLLKNLFGGGNANQSTPLGMEPSALGQASNLLGQQKFQLPSIPSILNQQGSQRNATMEGGLGNLSNLIPKPQLPSFQPPNLLNQFNAKSKEMIDRTTDWARAKQQALKEQSFGRLANSTPFSFLGGSGAGATLPQTLESQQSGSVTRNQPNASALARPSTSQPSASSTTPNYFAPPRTNGPAQPQIRSAANPNGQPTVRF